jgi:hypothetical protein
LLLNLAFQTKAVEAIEYCNIFVTLTPCNYIIYKKKEIFRKLKFKDHNLAKETYEFSRIFYLWK